METKLRLKKWGSSLGAVIPSEIVKQESLREGDQVTVEIRKVAAFKEIFGSLKGWKIDPQKAKESLREGWK